MVSPAEIRLNVVGRHALDSHTRRVQRVDQGIVYSTCECGATADIPFGTPEVAAWWREHRPGGSHGAYS